jgi:PBP1b-binding outer membrane lipoprotein LpoB
MTRAALLFILLLAGCSDEKPAPTQATNEMIESPLRNTVISSFDTYPPRPVDEDVTSSLPPQQVTKAVQANGH